VEAGPHDYRSHPLFVQPPFIRTTVLAGFGCSARWMMPEPVDREYTIRLAFNHPTRINQEELNHELRTVCGFPGRYDRSAVLLH
jgi:hypothetical protein